MINLSLPLDGLANLPLQLVMKDELGTGPLMIAASNALISAPVFVAWFAGFLRDAKGGGSIDRVFLIGGILLSACCYASLAAYGSSMQLVVTMALIASAGLLLGKTSLQAVMSHAARRTRTEDRAGALWNIVDVMPTVISYAIGPWLLRSLGASGFFLVCSSLACVGILLGSAVIGRPASSPPNAQPRVTMRVLKQLLVDPNYVRAIVVIFLFAFSPGWQTPILFYLTEVVGLSQAEYGRFWLFISLFVIVGCGLYYAWAKSASEGALLRVATVLMVLQSPLPLFIHDAAGAYVIGAVSGALYGFGIAAYWSFLIRSIPYGLYGASYMVAVLVSTVGVRGGDVVGSWMLERYGYILPFATTTMATVLIAPVLLARKSIGSCAR
jgi:MFS family permease